MNLRLFLLARWMPGRLHRRMLAELATATADALGVEPPVFTGLGRRDAVGEFARFTRTEIERLLASASVYTLATTAARLFERSRELGQSARRDLRITTRAEALRAVRVLYRAIGIQMDVDAKTAAITVRRCRFSTDYTPDVCAFVSALDSGFICGLTGDSRLVFSQRITEGVDCCRATLRPAERSQAGRPSRPEVSGPVGTASHRGRS